MLASSANKMMRLSNTASAQRLVRSSNPSRNCMYRSLHNKQSPRSSLQSRNKSTSSADSEAKESSSSVSIIQALVAATGGIATVSLVATIIESMTSSSVPIYDPNGERFDQNLFSGRFSKMLLACDPKLLFYTETQVREKQLMLEDAHNSRDDSITIDNHTLWESKRIVDSALNDQNQFIPRPFRMSGYVPYNGPICVAMIASTSTVPLLFWSWINQSQNALVNYYNRNSSANITNETIMKSYGIAVTSALTVAFGLATLIQKRYEPNTAKMLLKYVAFPSSVAASSLNCYIVRSPEITTGIPLLNEDGNNVLENETSQIAARNGVNLTTLSRAILQAPVFFLPPIIVSYLPIIRKYIIKYPQMSIPISTYLLLVSFGVGLPATVAIFPQISSIAASDVEPKFHGIINPKTNQPYQMFYYNKGL